MLPLQYVTKKIVESHVECLAIMSYRAHTVVHRDCVQLSFYLFTPHHHTPYRHQTESNMVRSTGFGSRLQTPTGGIGTRSQGSELPQGSFQSIGQSTRSEAQCRLPAPTPPAAPPPPPVVNPSELPLLVEDQDPNATVVDVNETLIDTE